MGQFGTVDAVKALIKIIQLGSTQKALFVPRAIEGQHNNDKSVAVWRRSSVSMVCIVRVCCILKQMQNENPNLRVELQKLYGFYSLRSLHPSYWHSYCGYQDEADAGAGGSWGPPGARQWPGEWQESRDGWMNEEDMMPSSGCVIPLT